MVTSPNESQTQEEPGELLLGLGAQELRWLQERWQDN